MRLCNTLIVVKDINQSKQFYKDIFGLHVVSDFGENVILTQGLVLQEKKLWESFIDQTVSFGGNEFELYFEEDNLIAFYDRLQNSKYKIEYINRFYRHDWGQHVIRFYDPDHHVIEVGESLQSVEEKKREEKMLRNKTIQYYDENALDYIKDTKEVDFLSNQNRFLERLTTGHCILDFGCGSGRDTAYFMQKGYQVEALDGSKELCVLASDFTGIEVEHCFFQEFDKKEKYDGIWACASLLHLSKSEMFDVFHSLKRALKVGGVLYVSFKYGEESRERKGRYFTDMTEQGLTRYVHLVSGLSILSTWISSDVRPDRLDEKWLNALIFREE